MGVKYLLIFAIASVMVLSTVQGFQEPGAPCISCHDTVTPGIVKQWEESKHSKVGVKCYVCHLAKEDDPAGFEHMGYRVTAIVSPRYCESCHPKQVEQFKNSLHDEAALFAMSAYGTVGEEKVEDGVTEAETKNYKTHFSRETAEQGCLDCHGTVIKVGKDGELINWPNNGIGRLNPDGSAGSCTACHPRHGFSIAVARKPETCGQCHLGPDHPQIEMYEESKHGNIYASSGEEWNWDVPPGQWGPEDIGAPTCSTCHMSGFGGAVRSTHDVSSRLKWELEPMFSWPTEPKYWTGSEKYPIDPDIAARYERIHDLPEGSLAEVPTGKPNPFDIAKEFAPEVYEKYVGEGKWWSKGETRADAFGGASLRSPEDKRKDMLKVCVQCHSTSWAKGDLAKADKVVDVYNAVALAIKKKYYDPIKEEKLDEDIKFNGKSQVDNLWHEIWHHEGRIWRMGGFMQAQDWQLWEGSYEVADDGSHMADWLEKLRTRKAVKEMMAEKEKGICGPTAVALLALLPFAGYYAMRRRKL
ncbi:multiheme c-type cytochrome [Candidatus Pyrohabitans sp.]